MKKFKVGDDVIVTNGTHEVNGKVVAILRGHDYDVVVTHDSFNEKMDRNPVSQLFCSKDGTTAANHVYIKCDENVVANVYAFSFFSEEESEERRQKDCVGTVTAKRNINSGELSNFKFTPIKNK